MSEANIPLTLMGVTVQRSRTETPVVESVDDETVSETVSNPQNITRKKLTARRKVKSADTSDPEVPTLDLTACEPMLPSPNGVPSPAPLPLLTRMSESVRGGLWLATEWSIDSVFELPSRIQAIGMQRMNRFAYYFQLVTRSRPTEKIVYALGAIVVPIALVAYLLLTIIFGVLASIGIGVYILGEDVVTGCRLVGCKLTSLRIRRRRSETVSNMQTAA